VGLSFHHFTGATAEWYFLGNMGPGLALLDYDNDGDIDVIVANNNGPARLLLNEIGTRNHWVKIRLVGV
jgi:hypothetical protein